ncbi:MAG: hypothetical protein RR049_03500, partial [Angelakisella sp.]
SLHNQRYTVSVKYLCAKAHVTPNTAYAALTALERYGYIKRVRNFDYNKAKHRVVWGKNTYICMLDTKYDFTFVPLSAFRKTTTPGAFVLLLLLRYCAGNNQRAFPSLNRIHGLIGMSRSWIQACIAQLDGLLLVHVENCRTRNGCFACNSYFLVAMGDARMAAHAPSVHINNSTKHRE